MQKNTWQNLSPIHDFFFLAQAIEIEIERNFVSLIKDISQTNIT